MSNREYRLKNEDYSSFYRDDDGEDCDYDDND